MRTSVRRCAPLLLFFLTGACGAGDGPGDDPGDDFVPARDLSLAELAAPPPVEMRAVRAPVRSTSGLAIVEQRVAGGELDRIEADLMLLAAFHGDEDAAERALGGAEVPLALPDALPGVIRDRFRSAGEEAQARYRELVERIYAEEPVASLLDWLGPAPAAAEPVASVSEVRADPAQRIVVIEHTGAAAGSGAAVLGNAVQYWPAVRSFHGISIGEPGLRSAQPDARPGGVGIQDWVIVQGFEEIPAGTPAYVGMDWGTCGRPDSDPKCDTLDLEFPGDPRPDREGVPVSAVVRADLVLEAKPQISSGQGVFNACSDSGTWPATTEKPAIEILAEEISCTLRGAVVHELFHCAHATAVGAEASYDFHTVPTWVMEGAATWSEDLFLPGDNSEWPMYECYADPGADPEACGGPVGPGVSLGERHHTSAYYFEFLEQFGGGEAAVRQVLQTFRAGGPLRDLPESLRGTRWLDFVDSSTGYQGLFDAQTPKLADSPAFPYAAGADCDGDTFTAGQEGYAAAATLEEGVGVEIAVDIPPLAAQHVIVSLPAGNDLDWIDVALAEDLDASLQALGGAPTSTARIRALIRSDWGERSEDWVERWLGRDSDAPDVFVSGTPSGGSFRLCLNDVGPCSGEEPIHDGLYEIRLAIANAATEERLAGDLILVPGQLPGWEAERYRRGTPEEQ